MRRKLRYWELRLFRKILRFSRRRHFFIEVGILIVIACFLFALCTGILTTPEKAGQFGDQFGAINTLFSGLAFVGFLAALSLQRKDLNLQKEEIRKTRREFEAQTKQFEAQTKQINEQISIQKQQNNITDFYRRIELLKKLESELTFCDYKNENNTYTGKQAIKKFADDTAVLLQMISAYPDENNYNFVLYNHALSLSKILDDVACWYGYLLTFVDDIRQNEQFGEERQKEYMKILLTLLSSIELDLLRFFQLHALVRNKYLTNSLFLYKHASNVISWQPVNDFDNQKLLSKAYVILELICNSGDQYKFAQKLKSRGADRATPTSS